MHILVSLACAVVAGWLTGLFMKGGGYGLIGDLVLGLVGGWLGGWLFGRFLGGGLVGVIVVSTLGAVILVALVRFLKKV
ncbi:MAG: GlsB/YeaQ/YmgE family stress response membrane protein [Thermoanaerobaculia bacterium]|jgi:uncharacterized membrane protein YeaQ/YmgE (transglycosylase-associated protein family)